MFAFTPRPSFPRRNLGSRGGPGRRILARIGAAACAVTCISAAGASSAAAGQAMVKPAAGRSW